ncbi:MAG: RIP metalloprotease RseP [bacterium]|nr:RIP metalloprotease RseP [bacterium]
MITMIAALIVFGIVIFFHELGHFLAAKKQGIKVEQFAIGFPPKLFAFKRGETEYRICAIPCGGYIKMAGENPDEELKGEPWEFSSAPVRKRMKIVLAGPLMNFVLGFVLFSLIAMLGVPTYSNIVGKVEKDSFAQTAGILAGDKIIKVNKTKTNNWTELISAISSSSGTRFETCKVELTILRDNQEIKKEITREKKDKEIGIMPYVSTKFKEVVKGCPAQKAGLKKGDVVTSINGKQVLQWDEMAEIIRKNPGKELIFGIDREGESMNVKITPAAKPGYDVDKKKEIKVGSIGILACSEMYRVNPLVALWHGLLQTLATIQVIYLILWQLIQGALSYKLLAGPIGIVQMSGEQAQLGLIYLLGFIAMLSVNLGVVNLLPLPILDGGHVLFLTLEKIRGKALHTKTQIVIQWVGITIIVCLTLLVCNNDIRRLLGL